MKVEERYPVSPLWRGRKLLLMLSGAASLLIAFLLIPLITLIRAVPPNEFVGAITDPEAVRAVILSLASGALAATIATVLGVPLGYILSRSEFRGKRLVEGLLDLPLVMPHSVAGIAVLLAYNSRSPVGSVLMDLGIRLEDSFWGIVAAMTFVSAPFAVNFAREGFSSVDIGLEYVARSLGAGPVKMFFTISLPLAIRGVITGWLMTLARAISEMGAVMIVAYHPTVGSVLVYEWFTTRGLRAAAALSLVLLLASLGVLAGLRAVRWSGGALRE